MRVTTVTVVTWLAMVVATSAIPRRLVGSDMVVARRYIMDFGKCSTSRLVIKFI